MASLALSKVTNCSLRVHGACNEAHNNFEMREPDFEIDEG